jgi:hypothetical protein
MHHLADMDLPVVQASDFTLKKANLKGKTHSKKYCIEINHRSCLIFHQAASMGK